MGECAGRMVDAGPEPTYEEKGRAPHTHTHTPGAYPLHERASNMVMSIDAKYKRLSSNHGSITFSVRDNAALKDGLVCVCKMHLDLPRVAIV